MAKRPNLTKLERERIIARYDSGESGSVVAKACGVSETTVWRWAKRSGVSRDPKVARRMVVAQRSDKWLKPEVQNAIRQRFDAGEKTLQIATSLGLRYGCVAQSLARGGSTRHLKVSAAQVGDAIKAYERGASSVELGRKYGVSHGHLLKMLKESGAHIRSTKEAAQAKRGKPSPKRSFTATQELEVCRLYQSGMTQRAIAKQLNVSATTVWETRKRHGIQTRKAIPHPGMGKYADGRSRLFRSSWERAFAAYLDSKLIEWNYEPKSFQLQNGKFYLPDFHVPAWGAYVEVKGFSWKDSLQKIADFREEYPEERLLLVNSRALHLYGITLNRNQSAEFITPNLIGVRHASN